MNTEVIIGLIVFSGLKLLMIPPSTIVLYENTLPLFQVALCCWTGASIGGVIFFYIGKALDFAGQKRSKNKKKKINFKRNRRIIKIKNRFQAFGVSMMMGILSVPIASILVGKYFGNDKKAIPSIIGASFIWAFTLTYLSGIFYDVIKPFFT